MGKVTSRGKGRNICLVGSGGVGTIAALTLQNSGATVTAVLRSKYAIVEEKGWDIESIDHGTLKGWRPSRIVASISDAAPVSQEEQYDFVVVSTKQLPDLFSVAELVKPVVTPGRTSIVLIQNGIDIEVPIIAAYPTNTVMSAVSHIGSRTHGENQVIHTGNDTLKIGAHFHVGLGYDAQLERTRDFMEMYSAGGAFDCTLTENISLARWEKILWNGTFNALCAITRMDVGELQTSKGRETLLLPMMREHVAIAKAVGYNLTEAQVQWTAYRLPNDCPFRPSMLLDLENGRPMELEVILANPLRKAKQYGINAPILSMAYELLKLEKWKVENLPQESH
ncbi:MAG: hypothetical protein M1818_000349 [Claussenomyces sp. TS43310]|nr:MAG: hypothetical protein M1818_000349 [Claussenomyces sp. TS43310]